MNEGSRKSVGVDKRKTLHSIQCMTTSLVTVGSRDQHKGSSTQVRGTYTRKRTVAHSWPSKPSIMARTRNEGTKREAGQLQQKVSKRRGDRRLKRWQEKGMMMNKKYTHSYSLIVYSEQA